LTEQRTLLTLLSVRQEEDRSPAAAQLDTYKATGGEQTNSICSGIAPEGRSVIRTGSSSQPSKYFKKMLALVRKHASVWDLWLVFIPIGLALPEGRLSRAVLAIGVGLLVIAWWRRFKY
jgi:hypothetical protein